VRRAAAVLALVLLVVTGCRQESTDQPFDDVESTLDAIESELAGD
jgi:uncharacterized protein YoxC